MLQIFVALATLLAVTRERVQERARDDRGSVSLEQVVIAVGLFVVAGVLVAAVTAAVRAQIGRIG